MPRQKKPIVRGISRILKNERKQYDIEPVLLCGPNIDWHHPKIEKLMKWEIDGFNKGKWAYNNHRVMFYNSRLDQYFSVIVRSTLLDKYWELYMKHSPNVDDEIRDEKEIAQKNPDLVPNDEETKEVGQFLADTLYVLLVEDVWCPNPTEQFCFTPIGKIVSDFVNDPDTALTNWSPDCGVSHDGPNEYSYST